MLLLTQTSKIHWNTPDIFYTMLMILCDVAMEINKCYVWIANTISFCTHTLYAVLIS